MRDKSPFELLGLEVAFAIDKSKLEENYARLRQDLHPDRFVNASPAERRIAEGYSADINEAYAALSDPLRRASCMLSMSGKDPFREEDNAQLPMDFLERQMELREKLDEIETNGDADAALRMEKELDSEIAEGFGRIASILDDKGGDLDIAVEEARKLKYLINCHAQTKKAASRKS